MGLKVKRGGVWTTPSSGSVRVKSGGVWKTATSAQYARRVEDSPLWVNSGYTAPSGVVDLLQATNVGDGDTKTVAFAWQPPISGPTVTGYRFNIYDSSNALISATLLTSTTLSRTIAFANVSTTPATAGSVYYVEVAVVSATGDSTSNPKLKVTIGAPSTSTPNYGWSETRWVTPYPIYAPGGELAGYPVTNANDNNFWTGWVSRGHTNSNTSAEWEGISCWDTDVSLAAGDVAAAGDDKPQRWWQGIRLSTSHRAKMWIGRKLFYEDYRLGSDAYGNQSWDKIGTYVFYGGNVNITSPVSGVPTSMATFIQEGPWVGYYATRTPAADGWIYLNPEDFGHYALNVGVLYSANFFQFSNNRYVGTGNTAHKAWSEFRVVFGGPFDTTPQNMAGQGGNKPYGLSVTELQWGYRDYISLPPTVTSATANVVTQV